MFFVGDLCVCSQGWREKPIHTKMKAILAGQRRVEAASPVPARIAPGDDKNEFDRDGIMVFRNISGGE